MRERVPFGREGVPFGRERVLDGREPFADGRVRIADARGRFSEEETVRGDLRRAVGMVLISGAFYRLLEDSRWPRIMASIDSSAVTPSSSARAKLEPMNPVAPMTTTFMLRGAAPFALVAAAPICYKSASAPP